MRVVEFLGAQPQRLQSLQTGSVSILPLSDKVRRLIRCSDVSFFFSLVILFLHATFNPIPCLIQFHI